MTHDFKKRIFFIVCAVYILCILLLPAIHYLRYVSGDFNYPPLVKEIRYPVLLLFSVFFISYWLYLKFRAKYFTDTKWPLYALSVISLGIYICAVYPVFSIDLYEFISRGRLWSVYNVNPYLHAPSEFPNDLFYNIIFWKAQPTIYGPLWAWLTWIPTKLAQDSIFLNQFFMKLILFVFYLLSGWQIYKLSKESGYSKPLIWAEIFLMNPFMLVTVLMDGHNDIVMVFFLLASLTQLQKGKDVLSIFYLILSSLAKYITVIFLPLYVIYYFIKHKDAGLRVVFAVKAALVSLVTILAVFWPFWQGLKTLGPLTLARASFHDNTITHGIYRLLTVFSHSLSKEAFMSSSQFVFMLFYVIMLLLFLRGKRAFNDLMNYMLIILIGYFCLGSFQFGSWYIVWLVPIIILSAVPLSHFLQLVVSFVALISFWKRISYLLFAAAFIYTAVYYLTGRFSKKYNFLKSILEIKGLEEKRT